MKKILSLFIILAIISSVNIAVAIEEMNILSDGGVTVEGNIGQKVSGVNVTLEVIESADEWLNEEKWMADPTMGIKYIEVTETDTEGKYAFDLFLDESGEYDCIASYDDTIEKFSLIYTNKGENSAIIEEIIVAENATAVYDILKRENSAATLMVANSEIYTQVADDSEVNGKVPLERVAEVIYDANDEIKGHTPFELARDIQRAALVVALNDDAEENISDINIFYNILGTDELGLTEYYIEEKSKHITELMKDGEISGLSDFEKKLICGVVCTNIRYSDSIDNTADMLKNFSNKIGVSKSSITNACVRDMLGEDFISFEQIKEFIKAYEKNDKPSSSGGGGGKSNGVSSGVTTGRKQYSEEYENPQGTTEGILPFEDVDGVEWAKPAINALYVKGIISGKTATEFCPDDLITREEFVKMLVSAFSLNVLGTGMDFEDVKETDWYYDYVRSAYYAEIVKGVSDNTFGAGMNITRQDIAVMGYRALEISNIEIPGKSIEVEFADAADISNYATEAVFSMQRAGILNGDEKGKINPTDYATRAEAAKIIYGIYQLL